MNLALWNAPFLRFVEYGLGAQAETRVRSAGVEDVLGRLAAGQADVALIPTDIALMASESLEILPAVAVSTWSNPFVSLTLPDGFTGGDMVLSHTPDGALTAFLASVVLKEHYGILSDVSPASSDSRDVSDHDVVTVQTADADRSGEPRALDLGQEWYELTNYPMVWALFVSRKGEATPELIEGIRSRMIALEDDRIPIAERLSGDRAMLDFCLNELRFRLDDLAVASLSSFADFLYFYGRTDQVPAVQFASLPAEDELPDGGGN
ncbi:MAG: hypothetical protein HKN17_00205 [Rhodothermales bacterium]|nr:hypothetical protein [Rhodothermales bacterium]